MTSLRRAGARSPLHGIPVLVKDNILASGMNATAGAAALKGFRPRRDATLVARLRAAGAIVIGKTNLTEFADYVSDVMPSGFSGAGGVVKNPHGAAPYGRGLGSSVGSAAAVAAALAPIAIGSETQNSIQTPSCVSSVYGFKPSVGMVSRAGVVPLVPSQDSPGPIARSIEDIALMLAVIAGRRQRRHRNAGNATRSCAGSSRPRDPATIRIGVPRRAMADRPDFAAVMAPFEAVLSKIVEGRCGNRRSLRSAERRAIAGRALVGFPHRVQGGAQRVPSRARSSLRHRLAGHARSAGTRRIRMLFRTGNRCCLPPRPRRG